MFIIIDSFILKVNEKRIQFIQCLLAISDTNIN